MSQGNLALKIALQLMGYFGGKHSMHFNCFELVIQSVTPKPFNAPYRICTVEHKVLISRIAVAVMSCTTMGPIRLSL